MGRLHRRILLRLGDPEYDAIQRISEELSIDISEFARRILWLNTQKHHMFDKKAYEKDKYAAAKDDESFLERYEATGIEELDHWPFINGYFDNWHQGASS